MEVKILSTTVAQKRIVRVGEILDLNDDEARLLISFKKAEKHFVESEEKVLINKEMLSETKLGEPKKRGRKEKRLLV